MKYKVSIISFIILMIYIYFITPQFISDFIYGFVFGLMKFIYIDNDNNLISYTFDHKNYDGSLMAYYIKKELINYNIEEKKNCINIYSFKPYQYLNNNRVLQFTRFTSSISYLLKDMIINQKRNIKVCIITSIRNKINCSIKKGNFIKLVYFTINSSDNIFDICSKLQSSVKNTKNKNYLKYNTTFHDVFSAYHNVNYIFNSWRDLSNIRTIKNKLLIRQSTNKVTKKDIFDLRHNINKKSLITLDFSDNKYIISGIINLN